MAGTKTSKSMGAAECARRTGLTVRTLRIYERHGLIEPMRTGKGWRTYGPAELQRLNLIVTLKAFGMTLEQIRAQLATDPPPLERLLQLQLQSCSARRDAADKAVGLIKTALATIKSGQPLSLENLCDLTRSMDMEEPFARYQFFRELVNETLTADEERAVMTRVAARSPDEVKAVHEAAPEAQALRDEVMDLGERNLDPAGPEVQALVVRENEIAVRHGLRAFPAALFEWNGPLADKFLAVSGQVAWRRKSAEPGAPARDFAAFFRDAQAASPWHRALQPIVDEAAGLADDKVGPSAPAAQALAVRLRQICADHTLGDPLLYVRWSRAFQFRWPNEDIARKRSGWTFLAGAVEAARA